MVGAAERCEAREKSKAEKVGEKKARLGGVGLGVIIGGIFQPRCAKGARDHRRQADPCQRARLTVVILTKAAAQACTDLIIGTSDDHDAATVQAHFSGPISPGCFLDAQNGKAAVFRPPLPFPKMRCPSQRKVIRSFVRQKPNEPRQKACE